MKLFETVAALTAASLTDGQIVETKGYVTAGDGGGARYLIQTAVAFGGTPDEFRDHTLANANVATLQANEVNVRDFGATGDGSTDDLAAFNAATAYLSDWETLYIPKGDYVLSGTWEYKNKYRTRVKCDGVLRPAAGFTDAYLVKFTNDSNDPIIPSMALNVVVETLTLDCEWVSRGVYFEKIYVGAFDNIHVWRPFGHGIRIGDAQECSFYKPLVIGSKARINTDITGVATDWDSGTTYVAGDIVLRNYTAYNAGTTYNKDDVASEGGKLYRSIIDSNLGNTISTNYDKWERVPLAYYECETGHTNKDPHDGVTDYTTRTPTGANRFWKPVYADEAALEMVPEGSTAVIDNIKLWNPIFRSNDSNTLVRVDNPENTRAPNKIDVVAPQTHHITDAYITAFNAGSFGFTITAPDYSHMWHLPWVSNFKVFGGQTQIASNDDTIAFTFGTLGVSGNAARTFLTSHYVEQGSGGDKAVGLQILPSVNTFSQWYESNFIINLLGTTNRDRTDLDGHTLNYIISSDTVPAGTAVHTVTFDTPLMAAPTKIDVEFEGYLGGLTYHIGGISKTGFNINFTGLYYSPEQTATFTAAGGANQTDTLTHNYGTRDDTLVVGPPDVDPGATYRVREGGSGANQSVLVAPAAPTNDISVPWFAVWKDLTPTAINFSYKAQVM